jgi:hypothetical protein
MDNVEMSVIVFILFNVHSCFCDEIFYGIIMFIVCPSNNLRNN